MKHLNLARFFILLNVSLLVLAACQTITLDDVQQSPSLSVPSIPLDAVPRSKLDGLWLTEEYGQLYEFEGDRFQIYSVTAMSCVPTLSGEVFPADAAPISNDQREAWLEIHILQETGVSTIGAQVFPGSSPDEKHFIVDGIASYMTLQHQSDWSETCQHPTPNTPLDSFDVFWQTYAEHYPFFEAKGIDWRAVRDHYRPQVSESTTNKELFSILSEMIRPLEDAHTWIQPTDLDADYEGQRPDPHPLTTADWKHTAEIVETRYLQTPIAEYANGEVAFGMLAGDVGYLRINGFSDYADSGFWNGMAELESALDDIFSQPLNGLIIDIRANDGGSDLYGLAVARRLTQAPYHAYTIQARNDPTDPTQWNEGQSIMVEPGDRPGFQGPVVLLTSRYSVSAAETFTMALMRRTPEVTRIGENTQGVFSVVLVSVLPNGWWFGLQNERFLTSDGITYDGPGIPPHIYQEVFSQDDLDTEQDSALAIALTYLGE